jgi:hypothetical protein
MYIFNSLYEQAENGQTAYSVDEKHLKSWDTYGVEQQAVLVEKWFSEGSSTTDGKYGYIQSNIRPARPWAQTLFPLAVSGVGRRASSSAAGMVGGTGTAGAATGGGAAPFRPGSAGTK